MKRTRKSPAARKGTSRLARAANTRAVLGPPVRFAWPERAVPRRWQRHYRRLLALRQNLLAERGELIQQSAEPIDRFSQHMADAASDDFDHDIALAELSAEQDALYEVEQALKRIEDGGYGICELTGRSIPAARLAAVPWARYTVEAGSRLEKRGAVGRARIGKLRSVRDAESGEPATLAETAEERESADADETAGAAPEEQLGRIYAPVASRRRGRSEFTGARRKPKT